MATIVPVTAAIIIHDDNVFIAQRQASDHMAGLWEFPGGKIDEGETPRQCLARELREEFDMEARIGKALGVSNYQYDHISIQLMAYQAFWNPGRLHLHAHQAFRWVSPQRLYDFAFTPADLPFVHRLARGEIELETA